MAEDYVDFRKVKELVSMQMLLDHYNIQLRRVNQNSLRGKCPLPTHSSDKSAESFSVQVEKNIFACQSTSCAAARNGKKGGNVIDFTAIMESCSIRDAAIKLNNQFLNSSPEATASAVNKTKRTEPEKQLVAKERSEDEKVGSETVINKPLAFTLRDVDSTHSYLRQRGIKVETAEHFGVGYFPGKGSMVGRVVIPIHNQKGELIAYAGRSIDGSEPKYKLPTGFVKSAVLFNMNRVQSDTVIVVEGFFDCIKVLQAGFSNVVALMGSSLSEAQEKFLYQFRHVVLFLDGDDAGRSAAQTIALRLLPHVFVRVVTLPDGEQPDRLSSDEIRTILAS